MTTDQTTISSRGHSGSTVFALLALIALIAAGTTAYFLYAETEHYKESPSVWAK